MHEFDQFRFDPADGRLENARSGEALTLRPRAARLLEAFLARRGEVIDRETLCREVWGEGAVVDFESGLAALMRELRQAIERVGGDASMLETVPRRGYRLKVSPRGREWSPPRAVIVAGVLTVIAAAAAWWHSTTPPPQEPVTAHALAILPFERYGDVDRAPEHAELLLADALLARFGQRRFDGLTLIGRASMRPYADRDDVSAAVAEDLGVDLLMEGSILADADGWTVTVRLLQVPPGLVVWSYGMDWPGQDRLPVADSADAIVERFERDWPMLPHDGSSGGISD